MNEQKKLFCGMNCLPGQQDLFPTDGPPRCERDHRSDLRSGDWDERAGGALHCIECGKKIGKFRQ